MTKRIRPMIHAQNRLTPKQILKYQNWLIELDREAHTFGVNPGFCPTEIWEVFDPQTPTGWQVYQSLTDETLLDVLICTMQHHGHSPHYEDVYYVYQQYLRLRFSGLNNAAVQARRRMKQLQDEARWPADWPERVNPEPFLEWLRNRHGTTDVQSFQFVYQLCASVKETGLPPSLSPDECRQFEKVGGIKRAFDLMGIPSLNHSALRHMTQYWQERRETAAVDTAIK